MIFNHLSNPFNGLSRTNFLLICIALIMGIISFTVKINVYPFAEQKKHKDNDYDLMKDPSLIGLRKYCNFLEDIQISDENSFQYREYNLTLAKLIILIRHGDRGPLKNVKNLEKIFCNKTYLDDTKRSHDENTLFLTKKLFDFHQELSKLNSFKSYFNILDDGCTIGQLTKFGVSQHVKLSSILSSNYASALNLDLNNLSKQIRINTTPYPRTFQSALSFLHGFFHYSGLNVFELVPNFKKFSDIYFCDFENSTQYCFENFSTINSTIYQTLAFNDNENFAKLVDKVKKIISTSPEVLASYDKSIASVFDALNLFVCHQERLPCHNESSCVTISDVQQIFSFISNKGQQLIKHHYQLSWMKIYGFLQNFIKIIQSNNLVEKFHLFSGHDLTIQALATVFGFADGYIPPYASRVIFEVYHSEHNNSKLIRVIYNGKDVTKFLPICKNFKNGCFQFNSSLPIRFTSLKNFILDTFASQYSIETSN